MKLELKHLKGYLGTGLQFLTCYNIESNPVIEEMTLEYLERFIDIPIGEKPLLLPLSALTEPLEDGSIPIVELAKMAGFKPTKKIIVGIEGEFCFVNIDKEHYGIQDRFSYFTNQKVFRTVLNGYGCFNQLQLFEYLYSIHADIYGLIDAGLAIDKRTIKL